MIQPLELLFYIHVDLHMHTYTYTATDRDSTDVSVEQCAVCCRLNKNSLKHYAMLKMIHT